MSLKDTIRKTKANIEFIAKQLESEKYEFIKNERELSDKYAEKARDFQKEIGSKLEGLKAKLKNKKLKKKNKKNIFEELVETVNKFLAAGRKANETDKFASTERLKYHAYGAAQVTMKSSRKIILDCAKKILFAGDGICGTNKTFDSLHSSCDLQPKEFDFLNVFRVPPDSDYGKIIYESSQVIPNKIKLNKELYNSFTSSTKKYQFDTSSNKTLFTSTWDVPTQTFQIRNLSQSGSTFENPLISQFFEDYYSNIEMPDFGEIVKNAMFLTAKCAKASVDKTGLNVGGNPTGMEDGISWTPDLDKAINDFERMVNKLLDFCNEKGVELGKQTAFRMFDDANENAEFYFDFDDVEGIDLEDEDARRRKVLVFKDCNNYEVPYNTNHIEDFIYLEGKKPINDWINLTLDKIAADAYEQSIGAGIRLPDFQFSLHLGFVLNIPKAMIMSLLSPKILLPITIIYKMFIGVAIDVKDLMLKLKEWFLCIINDFFWKFIREFWKRVKADLKNFLLKIVRKILRDKLRRYYIVIAALVALLKKLIEDGIETCEDLFEVISLAINTAIDLAGAKSFKIPKPLLLVADQLPGFNVVATSMQHQENMDAMGIPTGDINGEPNYLVSIFDSFIKTYTDTLSKTPIQITNQTMYGTSPGGPVLIPAMQDQVGLMKV